MFAAIPAAMSGACVMLSCTWLYGSGWRTAVLSSSICPGVWLETPKWRTFPAASSASKASATSSGSTSVSGRCSSSTSR